MVNEYKPNSNRFKESQRKEDNKQELKRIEKVVAGPVKTRKRVSLVNSQKNLYLKTQKMLSHTSLEKF